jgi:hypothetical protein
MIGRIIVFSEKDFEWINKNIHVPFVDIYFSKKNNFIPKKILEDIQNENYSTLIVGIGNIKIFHEKIEVNLDDFFIKNKLYYTYTPSEDELMAEKGLNFFKNVLIKKTLNAINFSTYDSVLDGEFDSFVNQKLKNESNMFVYFYNKAMYVFNEKNLISFNLESIRFVNNDVKSLLTQFFNKNIARLYLFSFENSFQYIKYEELIDIKTFCNTFFIKNSEEFNENIFLLKLQDISYHKLIPFFCNEYFNSLKLNEEEINSIKRFWRKDIITKWLSTRELHISKLYKNEQIEFKHSENTNYIINSYSNKRTLTGRINCIESLFNPQRIQKDSEERKSIVSRFKGGKIITIDYNTFETRISLFLSGDDELVKKYKNVDFHIETAKILFNKELITDNERKIGKKINHIIAYGGGDEKIYEKIKEEKLEKFLNDVKLNEIKEFLKPLYTKSEDVIEYYKENGFIVNIFGTVIRPQKKWAVYNNYIQSSAAEIIIEKLFEIKDFIKKNNLKSEFIFQVYDSFIFDVHPNEIEKIKELERIINHFKDIDLPVEIIISDSFFSEK